MAGTRGGQEGPGTREDGQGTEPVLEGKRLPLLQRDSLAAIRAYESGRAVPAKQLLRDGRGSGARALKAKRERYKAAKAGAEAAAGAQRKSAGERSDTREEGPPQRDSRGLMLPGNRIGTGGLQPGQVYPSHALRKCLGLPLEILQQMRAGYFPDWWDQDKASVYSMAAGQILAATEGMPGKHLPSAPSFIALSDRMEGKVPERVQMDVSLTGVVLLPVEQLSQEAWNLRRDEEIARAREREALRASSVPAMVIPGSPQGDPNPS